MKKTLTIAANTTELTSVEVVGLDLLSRFAPVEVVIVLSSNISVEKLLSALERTINVYPLVGGRLKERGGRYFIEAFDQGFPVDVVEADCQAPTIKRNTFSADKYRPVAEEVARLSRDVKEQPLAAVRLVRFSDGIVQLSLYFNHVLVDGASLVQFLVAWSNHYAGNAMEPPCLDRSIISNVMKAEIKTDPKPSRSSGFIVKPYTKGNAPVSVGVCYFSTLELGAGEFKALCDYVTSNSHQRFGLSDFFQALIFKAHGLSLADQGGETTYANGLYDIRRVKDGIVPLNYFGNGTLYRSMPMALKTLQTIPLDQLALEFRDHFQSDVSATRQDIKFCQAQYEQGGFDERHGFKAFHLPLLNGGLTINNTLNFRGKNLSVFGEQNLAYHYTRPSPMGIRMVDIINSYEGGVTIKYALPKAQKSAFAHHLGALVDEVLKPAQRGVS